jgi:adenosine deaminase
MRDLATLPKGHLHLHLEAGMQPALLAELAAKYDMAVPEIRGYGSFAAFSATYAAATQVLRDGDDWARFADELCAEHAREGAVYLEPSFWAGNFLDRFPNDETCWEHVIDVFRHAADRHGVTLRWMFALDRCQDDHDRSVRLAKLAVALGDEGVVSFGLANDEVGHPPQDFVDAFRIAREGGLLCTPHAGELEGAHFVRDSVDLLAADRIQHGVRSFELPGLVERLAELGTCLDVCPTSNIMLSVFPSYDEHPLGRLLDAGVRCSVNADDPLLFGPGLLEEYELCRDTLGFDDDRMAFIARCSIEAGGAPASVKTAALAGVDAWIATPA